MKNKIKYRLILSVCSCILLSCAAANETLDNQSSGMANPAVTKCLTDGLNVEPQVVNGVPRVYICVDPKTGLRCEAWAYFRGECPTRQR